MTPNVLLRPGVIKHTHSTAKDDSPNECSLQGCTVPVDVFWILSDKVVVIEMVLFCLVWSCDK